MYIGDQQHAFPAFVHWGRLAYSLFVRYDDMLFWKWSIDRDFLLLRLNFEYDFQLPKSGNRANAKPADQSRAVLEFLHAFVPDNGGEVWNGSPLFRIEHAFALDRICLDSALLPENCCHSWY
jgi:hypothetical protein